MCPFQNVHPWPFHGYLQPRALDANGKSASTLLRVYFYPQDCASCWYNLWPHKRHTNFVCVFLVPMFSPVTHWPFAQAFTSASFKLSYIKCTSSSSSTEASLSLGFFGSLLNVGSPQWDKVEKYTHAQESKCKIWQVHDTFFLENIHNFALHLCELLASKLLSMKLQVEPRNSPLYPPQKSTQSLS